MSETEKTENCMMEIQRTPSESLEDNKCLETTEGSGLNESQDFHLVDMSEDESADKLQNTREGSEHEEASCSSQHDNGATNLNEIKVSLQKVSTDVQNDKNEAEQFVQKTQLPKKSEDEIIFNESNNSEYKSKQSEDEDENVINCTPPEVDITATQLGTGNVTTNLKRKAGSFDEPPTKILRTISKDDLSMSERTMLEEEECCHSFKSGDSHHRLIKDTFDTKLIIAETQALGEKETIEPMSEILIKCSDKNKLEATEYKVDKNENFNDKTKLNECIIMEGHNEKASNIKDVPLSANNDTLLIKAGEKVQLSATDTTADSDGPVESKDAHVVNKENTEDKENDIERHTSPKKNIDVQEMSVPKDVNKSHSNLQSANILKSRKSIEVIYDHTTTHEIKPKLREVVEIDEDGEKIILDSSQEDSALKADGKNALNNTKSDTIYNSCYDSKSSSEFSYKSIEVTKESSLDSAKSGNKLVNGSSDSKRCDTDSTASLQSDTFSDMPVLDKADNNFLISVHNVNKAIKTTPARKDCDHVELLSVSDNEPDAFIVDDKNKSNSAHSSSITKALQMEKEIGIYVRMKCLLHVDESTKEFLNKEITSVQCEAIITEPTLSRQKNNDTSASLADISGNDNKDTSPGSVNSNPQLYHLNPSRLSFASTISSLSSASSAASLTAKLTIRDTHFSLPRAPVKHTKRNIQDMHLLHDKQTLDEAYERLSKEWQNSNLLTTTVLNFVNTELNGTDFYNVSHERIDDQLQKIRSSTPEVPQELVQLQTPKSSKKSKPVKRPRSKSSKSNGQSNGLNKVFTKVSNRREDNCTPKKKNKAELNDDTNTVENSPISMSQTITDDLIGKDVFAKWSDNTYYPGTVIDKIKVKYKVNFYDGKNKILIEDFIIPIPKTLKVGLSVYAATSNFDYGSCGLITGTETVNNEVYYTVETDEGEKLQVQIKDISLSADQAQLLKEEINSQNASLPSTPKHLGQITLDNMVDGKRRSKRIATPGFSTPKIKQVHTPTRKSEVEPSISGVSSAIKKDKKVSSESDGVSSDSSISVKDKAFSIGVQSEIIGTPCEQIGKGPQNRIKSKSRSKKKFDDEETIASIGPIPDANSNLFKGMSFILTCVSVETLDRFQVDSKDYGSDPGTENEEEWMKKPFVRDRLNKQIITGGGKVYTDFNEIPQHEYKNTKLITNVPNITAKALLCLSVGIPAYNHIWIIRCCQEGKIVNPAENELPVGWSLDKNSYIEMFQRRSNKPLNQVFIIIPIVESEKQFAHFWRQISENAGAAVLLVDKPDAMEKFVEGTVVLTSILCPSWAVEKANELHLPLLSTTWIVQCLIEGKLCQYDANLRYSYNYQQN